jgi:subtilase family serine protease
MRSGKAFVRPLAAALLMGTALPALAAQGTTTNRLLANAQDAGQVAASTVLTATVWLKGHDEAQLDSYVADRYDPSSSTYHQWMSPDEVAGFGPQAADAATLQASLKAQGLTIQRVSEGGTSITVSGTADKIQAAFRTEVHKLQSNGRSFFAATTAPQYAGAHPELVAAVSGLTGVGVVPFAARQIDLLTGQPAAAVPATASNPLSAFTTSCFNTKFSETMSGLGAILGPDGTVAGHVDSTFKGPSYLDTTTTTDRPACGYTAQQIVAHYGLDQVYDHGWTGKGQTIVIVDAYGSPTIQADVATFSKAMGLPQLGGDKLQVLYSDGQPAAPNSDWALETTLDVEWAHAIAPDAKIVLVVAPSEDDAELAYAVQYAAAHRLGNVISNSWGEPEAGVDLSTAQMFSSVFRRAAAEGISVNVATGDSGDNGVGVPFGAPSVPADSPFATGIGGTSIDVPSDKGPVESVWGIRLTQLGSHLQPLPIPAFQGFLQGGGGGESGLLLKPRYQRNLPGIGRQLPDVSALADPQTGAICVMTDSTGAQEFFVVGGTSLATPVFSAIWALADQASGESLGQAAPALAAMAPNAFRDIVPIAAKKTSVTGSITFRGTTTTNYDAAQLMGLPDGTSGFMSALIFVGRVPFTGYNVVGFGTDSSLTTGPGWDNATGYGVPNGIHFIEEARRQARKLF